MAMMLEEKQEHLKITEMKNENLNTFISIFPSQKPKFALLVMLENPKVAKELLYNYRGVKIKGTRNEAGWNSVYVAGKIIEKIGPILAIKSKDFSKLNVVEKNLINNLPKEIKSIKVKGLTVNSKKVKSGYIFLQLMDLNKMVKNLYLRRLKKAIAIVCSKKCKYYSKMFQSSKPLI